jgi:hypothetical protein
MPTAVPSWWFCAFGAPYVRKVQAQRATRSDPGVPTAFTIEEPDRPAHSTRPSVRNIVAVALGGGYAFAWVCVCLYVLYLCLCSVLGI